MKKTLLSLFAVVATMVVAQAQLGTVNFNNRVTSEGVNAIVRDPAGNPAVTPPYSAALALVGANNSLTIVPGSVTTFRTGAAAGFVNGLEVAIPGTTPGQTVTLAVVAFNGSSFETATERGQSGPVTVQLGGGTIVTPNMTGLGTTPIQIVPEPSTIALGVIGAAALLLRRRK